MSDAKTIDRFARIIAIFSLVIALAAVVLGILSYSEQSRQFQVLQSEELIILLNPHIDGPFIVTNSDFGSVGGVVQVPWWLTLSNTGNQRLSITRYSITICSSPGPIFYSDIDGGMMTADHRSVLLPLTLDPGESRGFFIFVGILVSEQVYEILSLLSDPALQTTANATMALGRQGLDLYGNRVDYQEHPEGNIVVIIEKEDQKSPTFCLQVVSGRGKVFSSSASYYEQQE